MRVDKIKLLGNFQTNFMWKIEFEDLLTLSGITGTGNDSVSSQAKLQILARTIEIPGKKKSTKEIRWNNKNVQVPLGTENTSNEFKIKFVLDENGFAYNLLLKWYMLYDTNVLFQTKCNLRVTLLNLDGSKPNQAFLLSGVAPLNIPPISELSQEGSDNFVEIDAIFSFDDIQSFNHNDISTVLQNGINL